MDWNQVRYDLKMTRVSDEAAEWLAWELAIGGFGVPTQPDPLTLTPSQIMERRPVQPTVAKDRVLETSITRPMVSGSSDIGRPSASARSLEVLSAAVAECKSCPLHEGRKQTVFGRGGRSPKIVFVGEGPGFHEDQEGQPFVGPAGQLLDKMIAAMKLAESEYYICNAVKCRPPENRTPLPDETSACFPFLKEQLESLDAQIVVALGRCAAEVLLGHELEKSWRGSWFFYGPKATPVMPTYHPAYLLRNPDMKRPVWDDLKAVMAKLSQGGQ